jgi:flagellin
MSVINTNVASLRTQAAMGQNTKALQSVMEQLSTGKRINSAADDAAGLAISTRLTSQINGLNQAVRNANDGISMLKTSEGATDTVTNMLQRMRELAIQGANGTNSSADIESMNTEYQQLYSEMKRIANTTAWNNMNVLDGTFSGGVSFMVSEVGGPNSKISAAIASFDPTAGATNALVDGFAAMSGSSISAGSTATDLLNKISVAISGVNKVRSTLGATINRLQFTVDNLTNVSTNLSASRSQIEDVDYSQATADLAKRQVIQQAATAMLAQANQQPQSVLSLLK